MKEEIKCLLQRVTIYYDHACGRRSTIGLIQVILRVIQKRWFRNSYCLRHIYDMLVFERYAYIRCHTCHFLVESVESTRSGNLSIAGSSIDVNIPSSDFAFALRSCSKPYAYGIICLCSSSIFKAEYTIRTCCQKA